MQHPGNEPLDAKKLLLPKFGNLCASNLANAPEPKIFFNTAVYISNILKQIHYVALYFHELII